MSQPDDAQKVFISYSHDSPEHMNAVLELSDRLRREGINCEIDQYVLSPPEGWPRWTINQIELADFVLVICTENYNQRFRGKAEKGQGRGVKWEGAILTQELYEVEFQNTKFIPLVLSAADMAHIPLVLRGSTHYAVDAEGGYEDLFRRLSNQPYTVRPEIGQRRSLPPRERLQEFSAPAHKPNSVPQSGGNNVPATWIFGSLLFFFLGCVFIFAPNELPEYKQRMLAFACSLLAGLFVFFLTGVAFQGKSTRSNVGGIVIRSTGGFALFILVLGWWSSPWAPAKIIKDSSYRVRATILGPNRTPIDDVRVTSSLGGEAKRVEGAWEFDIPRTNRPQDGKLIIYAQKESAFLPGQGELYLGDDTNPNITILMEKDNSARIKGKVVDASNPATPIQGALVYLVEFKNEAISTGPNGEFELAAHAAHGERVRIKVEKQRYVLEGNLRPPNHEATVNGDIIIRLSRQTRSRPREEICTPERRALGLC